MRAPARLGKGSRPPVGTPPGQGGKLWVYLPSSKPADHSLACVLIGAMGSDWTIGTTLEDEDQAAHLLFARAGLAVVAFEIDGAVTEEDEDQAEATTRFRAARAGMVNAHVALEYALNQVPAVDPARVSIAGYFTTGTLAVLFAEHETRLKSAIAFEPVLDFKPVTDESEVEELRAIQASDLMTRYSPQNHIKDLGCPLFLFHSRGNVIIPAASTEAFAAQAQKAGKTVTLDLNDGPFGISSLTQQGIPHAIDWLKGAAPR